MYKSTTTIIDERDKHLLKNRHKNDKWVARSLRSFIKSVEERIDIPLDIEKFPDAIRQDLILAKTVGSRILMYLDEAPIGISPAEEKLFKKYGLTQLKLFDKQQNNKQ